MAGEAEPTTLAQVLDLAERPRADSWSLRAALTRYGQPQPERASAILELVRRAESALRPHAKRLQRDGAELWSVALADGPPADGDDVLVGVLRGMADLDRLGTELAEWAVTRAGQRPDDFVDAIVEAVTRRFEELGLQRDERSRPPSRR